MDGHQFPTLSLTDKLTQADNGGEFMAKVKAQYETLQHQLDNTSPELLGNRASNHYGAVKRVKTTPAVKKLMIPRDSKGNRSTSRQVNAKSYNESTCKWSHVETSFKRTVEVQPKVEEVIPQRNWTVYRNDRVSENIIETLATLEQFLDDNGENITAEFRTMYFDLELCRQRNCPRCDAIGLQIAQAHEANGNR
jgi:hypothetical protein